MAFSPSVKVPAALQGSPSISGRESLLFRQPFPSNFILLRRPPTHLTLTLTFARRRNISSSSSSSKKKKKFVSPKETNEKEEDNDGVDGDALEALFSQLEEDLKNDGISLDDDDDDVELSEEELARLEHELGLALGVDEEEEEEDEDDDDDEEEEEALDEDEEEEMPVKLKNWQLRRLAVALKTGRRKTSIKTLAAELCLDRAIVLEMLRNPPPNLLLLSATLPDTPTPSVPETKTIQIPREEPITDSVEKEETAKVPVHVRQQSWTARKRLKKVHVETLERVYRRTKRPTNAMVSSIVQVTNVPRKRILKWFEDKRTEDGVPDHRLPYARSVPKSV